MTLRMGARNLLPILQVKRPRFRDGFAYLVVVMMYSWALNLDSKSATQTAVSYTMAWIRTVLCKH